MRGSNDRFGGSKPIIAMCSPHPMPGGPLCLDPREFRLVGSMGFGAGAEGRFPFAGATPHCQRRIGPVETGRDGICVHPRGREG